MGVYKKSGEEDLRFFKLCVKALNIPPKSKKD